MYDWSDLPPFLAVARAGSLSAAARQLKVNQSTVFRRIHAFEASIGVRLFDRLPQGYVLTAAGEIVRVHAERIEEEALALDRLLSGQDHRLGGEVTITTSEALASRLLTPILGGLARAYPDIRLTVVVDNRFLSLSRREADIALRPVAPNHQDLVGRRIGPIAEAVYGGRRYLRSAGRPESPSDLANHRLVGWDQSLPNLPSERWLRRVLGDFRPVYRTSSLTNLMAAIRAGLGLGVLPCLIGDTEAEIERALPPQAGLQREMWLITHRDLRHTARIRAVLDHCYDELRRLRPLLAGERPHVGSPRSED
jgi:DNA-binding transcriptional LysR family regulator